MSIRFKLPFGGRGKERGPDLVSPALPDVAQGVDPRAQAIGYYAGDNTPLEKVEEQLARQFDLDRDEASAMAQQVRIRRDERQQRQSAG